MSNDRSQPLDMVHGPLLKNIWIFAVPLMLTNMLQMLFNTADTVVVGRFAGEQALAAVGSTGSLCGLLISLFNGLSVGSNVLIAKYLGAGDHEKIEKSVHTSITMAAISGIFLMVAGFFLSRPLLQLMSTPADIIDLSETYMQIYFAGTFFLLIYNFGSAILRAKGDTKRPLYFLFICGVTNLVLNLLFVIVFHMSVAGVALATLISQALSAFLVCFTLCHEMDATRLDFKQLGIDVSMALDIIRIGVPAGIQGVVFSLSNVVVQSSINSLNSSAIIAGNSAANNIENFVYIGMSAFNQSCLTFTSQNVGAHNYKRISQIMRTTMLLSIISSVGIGVAVRYFGHSLLSLYTSEPAVIEAGLVRLTYVSMLLFLNGILDVFVDSMRGMGFSTLPTVLMIVGICGIRLTWLLTVFPAHHSLEVIYLCYPLSWSVTSLILGILWFFVHRKIMKQSTVEANTPVVSD